MIKPITLLLLFSALLYSLKAESSVWKITSDQSELYIGGTCHLLRASDFPLPTEFDEAYEKSVTLVFETDLAKLQDPSMQQVILSKGMLVGTTLDQVLTPATYAELSKLCLEAGLPIGPLNGFKPSMVVLMVTMMELQKIGVSQTGVDLHYFTKGNADEKAIEMLETVEEQIDFIFSTSEGNEEEFVLHSIRDFKKMKTMITEILDAWKAGDSKRLNDVLVTNMKQDYPEIYQTLIVERNNNWMPKIRKALESPEVEYFLVGVGHLVGEDGIIAQLKREGYKIEKI